MYTMQITALSEYHDDGHNMTMYDAITAYKSRDRERIALWNKTYRPKS